VKTVLTIACFLLFVSSLCGCSKKIDKSKIQFRNRITAEEFKQLLNKAEQGHAIAQFNLGTMYYQGEGVPQNYTEAMKWYKKAAEQEHAIAQLKLGLIYDKGHIGIPKNNIKAYIWYGLASEQGIEDAKNNMTVIESLMTTTEIAAAKKEAAKLRKKITKE